MFCSLPLLVLLDNTCRYVVLLCAAVHLALDLVLMFPCGLGIKGAAISTAVSEWLAAGAYVALVWGKRDMLGLWPPPQLQPAQLKERCLPFLQVCMCVCKMAAQQCYRLAKQAASAMSASV
jgi:hypothetical protein